MSYDPELPYIKQGKIENAIAELQEKKFYEMWDDLKSPLYCAEFIDDHFYERESEPVMQLFISVLENVATTRANVIDAPYENRNAIKAECYNQIIKALSEILDVEAKAKAKEELGYD